MTNRTITLKEKKDNGDYFLFKGKKKKRKVGYYGRADKFYLPKILETRPELLFNFDKESVFFKIELNKNPYRENKNLEVFRKYFYPKEGEKIEKDTDISGKNIINVYRVFQLVDQAKRVAFDRSYAGGGFLGDVFVNGVEV